jgi:pyrimidine operon attenuation protein/uracil phosphoribosyltransferase
MSNRQKLIVEPNELRSLLEIIIGQVARDRQGDTRPFAVIGIRDKGAVLGKILAGKLSKRLGRPIPFGILDIGLYRDDVGTEPWKPKVRATEIDFNIEGMDILLVDDVLHTGRTIRAALDALTDLGRPGRIQLAVLIDRAGRELPIAADYVARHVEHVQPNERIRVVFQDGMDVDGVFLETKE